MKITCQACHSKYNVADEKVQGKIVKIRCRKCGATIVVHGNVAASASQSPPSEAPAAGRITSPDQGQWHISLSDTDQRTMTLAELVSLYKAGVATQETFVWTDGMPDWKPLLEVEAIVVAVNSATKGDGAAIATVSVPPPAGQARDEAVVASPAQPAAPVPYRAMETTPVAYREPEPTAPVDPRHPEAAAAAPYRPAAEPTAPIAYRQPEVAGPVAQRKQEATAPFIAPRDAGPSAELAAVASTGGEPRRASLVKRENRGRDLFGAAPEGPAAAEESPARQYAAPYADVAKPTGQRNENSVLFSLAMLTKSGEERAPQPAPSATTDDSGMIDLKALAEKAASMRPAADGVMRAPALSTKAEVYIPPLAVSPSFGSYMGANPARPTKSRTLAFVGAGVGVIALVVFGVFLGAQLGASNAVPVIATVDANAEAPDAAGTLSAAAAPSASDSAGEAAAAAAPSAAPSAPSARAAAGWHPPPGGWPARPTTGGAAAGGGGAAGKSAGGAAAAAGGGAAAAAGGAASAAAAPPPPKKTSDCGCNGDLMCLMKCSASGH
ncbi:MAG: zinc-ribbon domain-containing protein [Polyangiaceae bacterium]|jgi:predicted Zn finger-like uncharacterized protein